MKINSTNLYQQSERGDTLRSVIWTLVAVLGIATIAYRVLFREDESVPVQSTPSYRKGESDNDATTQKTRLNLKKDSKTGSQILSESVAPWLRKNWMSDNPPAKGANPEKWKQLVEGIIAHEVGDPRALPVPKIWSLSESMSDKGRTDPLHAYIIGTTLPANHPEKKSLLDFARKGFGKAKGSEILAYHAAVAWARADDASQDETEDSTVESGEPNDDENSSDTKEEDPIEICLQAMKKALDAHDGFSKFPDRLAGFLLVDGSMDDLLGADPEGFYQVVKDCKTVKPWLKKWIEGKMYHKIGWSARGGGYWNSVSDSGRALFPRNMQKAYRSMEEAWKLEPDHPGVAADLIAVSMAWSNGKSDEEHRAEMFTWLERMSEVQIDYDDGYTNVLWGLRKRWHGEFDSMAEFGEMCLESGRFDSQAPWYYLQALRDTSTEWDLPTSMFPEFRDADKLIRLFEGAENEPKREPWRQARPDPGGDRNGQMLGI